VEPLKLLRIKVARVDVAILLINEHVLPLVLHVHHELLVLLLIRSCKPVVSLAFVSLAFVSLCQLALVVFVLHHSISASHAMSSHGIRVFVIIFVLAIIIGITASSSMHHLLYLLISFSHAIVVLTMLFTIVLPIAVLIKWRTLSLVTHPISDAVVDVILLLAFLVLILLVQLFPVVAVLVHNLVLTLTVDIDLLLMLTIALRIILHLAVVISICELVLMPLHVHSLHLVHYFGLIAADVLLILELMRLVSLTVVFAVHVFLSAIFLVDLFVFAFGVLCGHVLTKLVLHDSTT
jgi:hypothetical protein